MEEEQGAPLVAWKMLTVAQMGRATLALQAGSLVASQVLAQEEVAGVEMAGETAELVELVGVEEARAQSIGRSRPPW